MLTTNKKNYWVYASGFIVTLFIIGVGVDAQNKAPLSTSNVSTLDTSSNRAGTFTIPPSTVLSNEKMEGSGARIVKLRVNGTAAELNLSGAPYALASFVPGKTVTFRANSDGQGNLTNPQSTINPDIVNTSSTEEQSLEGNSMVPGNINNSVGSSEVTLPSDQQFQSDTSISTSEIKTVVGRIVEQPKFFGPGRLSAELQTEEGNYKLDISSEVYSKLSLNTMQNFTINTQAAEIVSVH